MLSTGKYYIQLKCISAFVLLIAVFSNAHAARFTDAFDRTERSGKENKDTGSLQQTPRAAPRAGFEQARAIEHNAGLSLREAERIALENDSLTAKILNESVAMQEKGIAASRLPDPKIKLGIMNLPTDTFEIQQEPMTQQVIGFQQMFPPFNMTDYMGEQMSLKGKAMTFKAQKQRRETLRGLRQAWLNVYKQHHSFQILKKSEMLFDQLVKITKSQYRQGQGNQQNVVRAQLELSLLQDKQINVQAMKEMALADMNKWLGPAHANRGLELDSLDLPDVQGKAEMDLLVERHPGLQASVEMVSAAKAGIDVAKSRYKPSWMVDLTYGKRDVTPAGDERADFISLMFMVDLPFFTSKRQDKWLNASEKEYNAAQNNVDERRKNLKRMLDMKYVKWQRLTERLQHFRGKVLPQSGQNAEAALKAYRSQVTDFNPLMRARLMELKNKLQALHLLVDRANAQVDLLYLTGDGK